jgi:hypothetical protein
MDLPECPFCYAPIQIMEDGTCPACKKNTFLATEENLQYSAAEISADQLLPNCCTRCGSDTRNIENFVFRYDSHLGGDLDQDSYFAFILAVVMTAGLALFLLPLYRRRLRKYRGMVYFINLPCCESCLPDKPAYVPITIEGNAFHLKVHKSFKAKLLAHAS